MKAIPAVYVSANLVGLGLYAWLLVRTDTQVHAESRLWCDIADSMKFAMTAFPAVNVSWRIWATVRLVRHCVRQALARSVSATVSWIAVVVVPRQLT